MDKSRLHLLISGHVQGVGYRISAHNIAEDLGLTGWVSNTPDGRVEITVEGEISKLEQLSIWARQGPHYANVSEVMIKQLPATGEFKEFFIC